MNNLDKARNIPLFHELLSLLDDNAPGFVRPCPWKVFEKKIKHKYLICYFNLFIFLGNSTFQPVVQYQRFFVDVAFGGLQVSNLSDYGNWRRLHKYHSRDKLQHSA